MATLIESLLMTNLPEAQTATVRVPRVQVDGAPLELTIRQLSYNRISELRKLHGDFNIHTVLAGVAAPDLRDAALLEHFDAATPEELVKMLLLPGEIEAISAQISKLSGFGKGAVELVDDIQKN